MKKITMIISLFSVFLLFLVSSPSLDVQASTTWNNDYVFDALSITHNGVSLSIDEATNVFTIHGTTTGTTDYVLPDLFTPNGNGSSIQLNQDYVAFYEYVSGTVTHTGSSVFKPLEVSPMSTHRQIYLTPDNSTAIYAYYQMNRGIHFKYTTTTSSYMRMNTTQTVGVVFNQLKYRITIQEVDPLARSIDMFSTTSNITNKGIAYSFPNANTLVMNGNSGVETNLNFASRINGLVTDPSQPVLIYVKNTSGTTNDLTWGFSINTMAASTPGNPPQISYSASYPDFGIALDSIINFYLTPNQSGKIYTTLTFEFYVQEIHLEISDTPTPPTPGETTTPPEGFYLVGSYWLGQIYYNQGEDLPAGSYYIATTEGATFDFDILIEEQINFSMDEGVIFRTYYDSDQAYDDFSGPGDIVLSRSGDTITVQHLIDDVVQDSNTYNMAVTNTAISSFVVMTAAEPVTEVAVSFFDDEGVILLDSGIYEPGDLIIAPEDPVKANRIFVGWEDSEGTLWNFASDTVGETDLDLYAVFVAEETPQYTVTFNSNGGSAVDSSTVYEGSTVIIPIPTRTGYTFSGWYLDDALTLSFASNTPITEDMTLNAKWTPTGGGTVVTPPAEETSNTYVYIAIGVILVILATGYLTATKKG